MLDSVPPPSFKNVGGFTTNIDRWSDFKYIAPSSVLQWGGGIPVGTCEKIGSRAARCRCASSTMQRLKARTNTTISSLLASTGWMRTLGGQQFCEHPGDVPGGQVVHRVSANGVERDRPQAALTRADRAVAYSEQAIHEMQAAEAGKRQNESPLILRLSPACSNNAARTSHTHRLI